MAGKEFNKSSAAAIVAKYEESLRAKRIEANVAAERDAQPTEIVGMKRSGSVRKFAGRVSRAVALP